MWWDGASGGRREDSGLRGHAKAVSKEGDSALVCVAGMGAEHDHDLIDGGLFLEVFEAVGHVLRRAGVGAVGAAIEDRLLVRRRRIRCGFLGREKCVRFPLNMRSIAIAVVKASRLASAASSATEVLALTNEYGWSSTSEMVKFSR
jgi:hypothetical protein